MAWLNDGFKILAQMKLKGDLSFAFWLTRCWKLLYVYLYKRDSYCVGISTESSAIIQENGNFFNKD